MPSSAQDYWCDWCPQVQQGQAPRLAVRAKERGGVEAVEKEQRSAAAAQTVASTKAGGIAPAAVPRPLLVEAVHLRGSAKRPQARAGGRRYPPSLTHPSSPSPSVPAYKYREAEGPRSGRLSKSQCSTCLDLNAVYASSSAVFVLTAGHVQGKHGGHAACPMPLRHHHKHTQMQQADIRTPAHVAIYKQDDIRQQTAGQLSPKPQISNHTREAQVVPSTQYE